MNASEMPSRAKDARDLATLQTVPAELRELSQWVCWKLETIKGRLTKVPYTPQESKASTTDPRTWSSFEACLAAHRAGKFNGVGFVFKKGNGLTGIDLDDHRDQTTGELDQFANDYVVLLDSYTEVSQSGAGIHVIARGIIPSAGGKRSAKHGVEMYSSARFFVMTGKHLEATPCTIENRQEQISAMFQEVFAEKKQAKLQPASTQPLTLTDAELVAKASEAANGSTFSTLWRGDFTGAGHGSQSEADAALLALLYFWTGGDKARSFRLFSESGLKRDKWEREDYRESTWALVAHGETYSSRPARKSGKTQSANGQNGRTPITPAQLFAEKFPALAPEYGEAILETTDDNGTVSARDIGEDFFAATLGEKGSPDMPTIFLPTEEKFYRYTPTEGVFVHQREPGILAQLSRLLLDCARACKGGCETRSLEFRFRDAANLSGVLRKARGVLEVPHDFFASDLTEYIPAANGMLRLRDKMLLPFSPTYRRRNKLAVPYDPRARCPLFLETLMHPALDPDDLDLVQRACGLFLIGENLAQKILILTGTAGGGKGTLVRVICGVIGAKNLASLRTQLLGERFEIGRFLGCTLLYGADVPENFLNQRGASVLKSLTGYDPLTLEFKNSNERPSIICRFNIVVTCNSRLTVHLEGDVEAWRRRLCIVDYHKPKPARVIADLGQRILSSEAAGVLNWMLAGLDKVRADGWQLHLTAQQQASVDNLLLESDGHTLFVREALVRADRKQLTVPDAFAAYVEFCSERDWVALSRKKFGDLIGDAVVRNFGLTARHDILDASGKAQRGWNGLALLEKNPQPTGKGASAPSEPPPPNRASDGVFPVQPGIKLVEELW